MTIGVDISPIKTGHKFRGIGSYTENLFRLLGKYDKINKYTFFTRKEKLLINTDLVHYPYFEPFFLTLPLKKDTPTVVTVHDLTPLVFPDQFPRGFKGEVKWQIQKWSLKGARAVIVDSECSKKDVIRLTGIDEKRVFVVYLAAGEKFRQLKHKDLTPVKIKYNLPEKFVFYVGA